ncbi:MAG: ATP-binding cassette domain-containing protein [Streptosporangiales bacterium]|nr:ATP-binding cassette domain-containing protein [Streptosporangiales bacterium]
MASVAIDGLAKHFGALRVFDDLHLDVADDEFVSILGPSGCGKTTLLRLVAGLEDPTAGSLRVSDEEVTGPRPNMAVVFQNFRLLPWRTVEDNVAYGVRLRGGGRKAAREQVGRYIAMVGLEGWEKKYPYQLSGGMQQRVGLARALAIDPALLLMDEPFGALDAQTREQMQEELLRIWHTDRKTVLFVTHAIDEAIVLSDRVIVMQAGPGRIVDDIAIPFERPRDAPRIRLDPRFTELRARMWSLLRQEPAPEHAAGGISGD